VTNQFFLAAKIFSWHKIFFFAVRKNSCSKKKKWDNRQNIFVGCPAGGWRRRLAVEQTRPVRSFRLPGFLQLNNRELVLGVILS